MAAKLACVAATATTASLLVSVASCKAAEQAIDSLPSQQRLQPKHQNLLGTWTRDKKSSDSIEGAMSVMQINPFLKIAMRQLKGIELKKTDSEVVLVLLSRFSWFRLHEHYPISCQPVSIKRRDFRRGQAHAALSIDDDCLWIDQQWDEPMAGHGSECAWSPEPGTLYVDSTIKMQGKTAQYRQVYHRKSQRNC